MSSDLADAGGAGRLLPSRHGAAARGSAFAAAAVAPSFTAFSLGDRQLSDGFPPLKREWVLTYLKGNFFRRERHVKSTLKSIVFLQSVFYNAKEDAVCDLGRKGEPHDECRDGQDELYDQNG